RGKQTHQHGNAPCPIQRHCESPEPLCLKIVRATASCNSFAKAFAIHSRVPPLKIGKRVGLQGSGVQGCRTRIAGRAMTKSTDAHLPPTFQRLAWSNLAAQSAEQIALAAAPIVAVLLLGVAEGESGLLQTALTLPFVLFAIPAGLLADRMSRRWLMAGAEAVRAAALVAILLLIWFELLTLNLLALLGFASVCGTVVYSVAAPALVPSLVSPSLLPAANARVELARTAAFASGPALGGV